MASKLCVWDIEIMTREELDEQIEQAVMGFSELDGVDDELAEKLVGEGFLSYGDLSVIEPDALSEMGGGLTQEQVDHIVEQAEAKAEQAEKIAAEQKRLQRERDRREVAEQEAATEEEDSVEEDLAEEDLESPLVDETTEGAEDPPTAEDELGEEDEARPVGDTDEEADKDGETETTRDE